MLTNIARADLFGNTNFNKISALQEVNKIKEALPQGLFSYSENY
jgi:hypothetical protein